MFDYSMKFYFSVNIYHGRSCLNRERSADRSTKEKRGKKLKKNKKEKRKQKEKNGECEKIKKKVTALRVTTFEQPTRRYTRGPVRVYQPSPTASRAGNVDEQRPLRADRFKNTTCASGPANLLDSATIHDRNKNRFEHE